MIDSITEMMNLIDQLNLASSKYYNSETPIMTDSEWDNMLDRLAQLERKTGTVLSSSPTQNVGYEVKSKLNKVEHKIPLLSLGKTKDINELYKFQNNKECMLMLKGDGLTHELDYNNSEFIQGSTRGNSIIGEDVSFNVKTFKNVPLHINYDGNLKVTGEAVIFDNDFQAINEKENGRFANSRNLVAGTVRNLDSKICASRNVNFMAFNIIECDREFETVEEQFEFLGELGFYTIFNTKISSNITVDKLQDEINKMRNLAKEYGVPIDGMVLKYNDIAYGNSLGSTAKFPLNAEAFKFFNKENETMYDHTEWNTSRTGILSPVGVFQPTDIEGSTIERATLHNVDYFEDLQLGQGDTICLIKANEVMPKITDNLTRSNTEKIPNVCPICNSKTEVKTLKTARVLMCTNEDCPSRKVAQFEHFCSRDAMNIVGVSESIIETFISKGFLKTFSDIYKLDSHKSDIIKLEGFGIKSYNKIWESIQNSIQVKMANFIFAMGIPNCGLNTSKLISKFYKNNIQELLDDIIQNIECGMTTQFNAIDDIGQITSDGINDWFNNEINFEMFLDLVRYMPFQLEPSNITTNSTSKFNPFRDKTIVVTGSLINYTRQSIQDKLESLGAKTSSSVSKKTDYVLVGENAGSKYDKAKQLGVKIIDETTFEEMINYDRF
jgi:DNA ligase (NAD+)